MRTETLKKAKFVTVYHGSSTEAFPFDELPMWQFVTTSIEHAKHHGEASALEAGNTEFFVHSLKVRPEHVEDRPYVDHLFPDATWGRLLVNCPIICSRQYSVF